MNAIDCVESLKEKYEKNLQEIEQNIPMLQQLVAKPFEKENDLVQLKRDVSKLEREISIKIQENQIKRHNAVDEQTVEIKETSFVKTKKTLLPKKDIRKRKIKGMRI